MSEPLERKLSELNVDPECPITPELSWPDWFAMPLLKLLFEKSPRLLLLNELLKLLLKLVDPNGDVGAAAPLKPFDVPLNCCEDNESVEFE